MHAVDITVHIQVVQRGVTHSVPTPSQAPALGFQTQPRPRARAHTSQLGYRAHPLAACRTREEGEPTSATS